MSHYRRPGSGGNKVFLGLIIIVVGVLILLKQLGMIPYLNLHRTWPFVLIVIGVAIGMRNRFTTLAPYILIAIGFSHLIPAFSFTLAGREIDSEEIVIPLLLVGAGLFIMFRPHRRQHWSKGPSREMVTEPSMEADVIFGGRKEVVTSKDFKGGRITATFGGCEVNLLQADSTEQQIFLDVRATFGGCEIIVPSSWEVKNEVETILGSVEDRRTIHTQESSANRKTLVLRGSCFCGGIEIKSF